MKLSQTREDARTVVDAVGAVRTCFIRQGKTKAFDSRLAALFTKVNGYGIIAPDVSQTRRGITRRSTNSPHYMLSRPALLDVSRV